MPRSGAGPRRHLVTIQQDSGTTTDVTQGHVANWVTYCEEWVSVEGVQTSENTALRRQYAEASYAIRAVYNTRTEAITPAMRVYWRDRAKTLQVLGTLDPDGRGRDLLIAAKELDIG